MNPNLSGEAGEFAADGFVIKNGHGQDTAGYGDYLLENLSKELSNEFGKGYSKRKLELIRKFYLTYKIAKTPFSQSIGWSHYLHLIRIVKENERKFYEKEIENNNWSVTLTNHSL